MKWTEKKKLVPFRICNIVNVINGVAASLKEKGTNDPGIQLS